MDTYGDLKAFSEENPCIFIAGDEATGDAMAKEYQFSTKTGRERRNVKAIIKEAEMKSGNQKRDDDPDD